jgi:hypothetical protein
MSNRTSFLGIRARWIWKAGAVLLVIGVIGALFVRRGGGHAEISYNEAIRPIFNEQCIACHGGVKREGGFSLLFRADALDTTESGKHPLVPGDPDESEIIRRVTHSDPDERMPPKGEPLTAGQITKLKQWIEAGAHWERHWAYVPPVEPALPDVSRSDWPRSGVDHFILVRLEQEGLAPSPRADCHRLMRRLHLDVVGLPPSADHVAAFCANPSPSAYEQVVDSLLASPRFGEHWASMWLDLARYADSKGYERDPHRTIWTYRDWVIRAFNQDMPFDQFTTEQLAGDLLPEPTKEQLIATAFHRNTMTNTEGGTRNEEFRVAAVIDRINTTMNVWQGTTMECVQCHGHPYDPFRQTEYYELYAFFNNTEDADRSDDRPRLPTLDEEKRDQGAKLAAAIARLENERDSVLQTADMVHKRQRWEASIQEAMASATDDVTIDREAFPVSTDALTQVLKIINTPEEERSLSGQDQVVELFGLIAPELEPLRGALQARREALDELDPVYTPIMQELPPGHSRTTHVFERGNWLTKGEKVQRDVPASLNDWPEGAPRNRWGLAQWLTSDDNPLTARVTVNRFWAQIFGQGLVKTLSDFGTQGARPTHPELLDWLALRFMHEYDWHVKPLIKELVLSATYQQTTRLTPERRERDPRNELLARGPRVRLSAEQVRDQALAVSGLLSDTMYGPSVMPPQPEGIWENPYNGQEWVTSEGEDRYRRAVYTYWKRTNPYPSMVTFDAPSRETSVARRIRTNTPLQALVTLNDPVYMEAARALAQRVAEETDGTVSACIERAYHHALLRPPDAATIQVLQRLYRDAVAYYHEHPAEVDSLRQIGALKGPSLDGTVPVGRPNVVDSAAEMAGLTVVANAIMNLDAFIMTS